MAAETTGRYDLLLGYAMLACAETQLTWTLLTASAMGLEVALRNYRPERITGIV